MASFEIKDEVLTGFKGKVAVVTGGSSGIGLATVELLGSLGASVVNGDVQAPKTPGDVTFVQADVRSWTDLVKLFKTAKDKHGRVDYVFVNAGIGPRANYLELEVDENGDPKAPNSDTVDINLDSVINTTTVAAHYLKGQPEGGSIVLMGSSTGLHPVRAVDYSTAKAGVLGFGRGFAKIVEVAGLPIRVNTLIPSWTDSQVLPDLKNILAAVSQGCQPASVVARAVAYLFVEKSRHGDVIFICDGKYTEVEKTILAPAYDTIRGEHPTDDEVLARVFALGG
ncbi:NAD(P)-binding protein [Aaosphaeria arxii CBS 175.79]|uniref:NAD(P)-binding protein n=1 Tax=Aaosphaeria arxii CBS 175.79 TaxID=1450172 RepID=A0A6A5XXL8_9PLEO|nr:NAD(P)-binding protein [Aaosphaeria arxii CBS 175.79]KAF2017902.1 NAD(P)-binding protein [Aaosphaeria arxii CBS 175.79]